jgi:diguanylate cyclase (GGDEF)-like protein
MVWECVGGERLGGQRLVGQCVGGECLAQQRLGGERLERQRLVERGLGRVVTESVEPPRRALRFGVWHLNASLGVAAGALFLFGVRPLEAVGAPVEIPFAALVGMFLLTDACMVHLHFRRDAHSFTLAEIPLVLGLFFASPAALIAARLLGAVPALLLVRRQAPQKLVFNLGLFLVDASLAVLIFHVLTSFDGSLSTLSLFAVFAATTCTSVLSMLLIFGAISLSEGELRLKHLPASLQLGAVVTVANTSLALIGVALLWRDVTHAWLLLLPAGVLFVAYRLYIGERKKHRSLEFLYDTTRQLHGSTDVESALIPLLEQARDVFRAGVAEIVLFPNGDGEALRTTLGPGGRVEVLRPVDHALSEPAVLHAVAEGQALLLGRPSRGPGFLALVRGEQTGSAMMAPLRGDEHVLGTLLVGERIGDLRAYDAEDFQLFETFANQAGLSLELLALGERLKHQAFHDPLTDLPNWAWFREQLETTLMTAAAETAVLVFDVDDFKTVNDSLGHAAGDQLLVAVAERLCTLLEHPERAARLGGDEFAVLLEGYDREAAAQLAESVIDALTAPFFLEGKEVAITASLGIALAEGQGDAGELLRNADLAMYKAKAEAKGRYHFFEDSLHTQVVKRLELKADLQSALERGEFFLHYQPIIELETGSIAAVEALLRWNHPERGLIPPAEFIPLAEETGLIVPLGRWVLTEALRQAAAWDAATPDGDTLGVTVNLSAVQLERAGLVNDVARALGQSGLPAHALTLEITESIFMKDAASMANRLRELKSLGVLLAIDDFGTGYSSLGYLARCPIDVLKIAKPFVDAMSEASDESALAHAIIRIGESLGLHAVAEGIEREDQRDRLRELGCPFGQGFLFSRPIGPAEVTSLLHVQPTEPRPAPADEATIVQLWPAAADA